MSSDDCRVLGLNVHARIVPPVPLGLRLRCFVLPWRPCSVDKALGHGDASPAVRYTQPDLPSLRPARAATAETAPALHVAPSPCMPPSPPQVPSLNSQGLIFVQPSLVADNAAVRRGLQRARATASGGGVQGRVAAYAGFGAQARGGSKGISQAPTPAIWVGNIGPGATSDGVRAVFGRCGPAGCCCACC